MADPDSAAATNRLDAGLVGDKDSRTSSLSTSHLEVLQHFASMNDLGAPPREVSDTRPSAAYDATRFSPITSGGNLATRDPAWARDSGGSQPTGYPASTSHEHHVSANASYPAQLPDRYALAPSQSNSQAASSLANGSSSDPVFTPPTIGGRLSPGNNSSQESQLLQLSQIAAAQERIPEDTVDMANGTRKRMADGVVKHSRDPSNVSPGQMAGHSRNTSTVSAASTSTSRIGELSAELKARLSYAMVKVNHGWQGHSIDQVESLASQGASPASTASTIHLRNGSSASPQLSAVSHRASNNTTPATGPHQPHSAQPGDMQWGESTSRGSSASPVKTNHGLAPPVSIQPSQPAVNPRREPNPRHVPSFLSASPRASDLRGASPYLAPGRHRSEAMLVSPHTNVREQDAIESLLFMSSPGNSANLKHAFPTSASQPLPSSHAAPYPQQRTALPTSQPRKSLPSGRPPQHNRSQSHSQPTGTVTKRVGFEKSPSAMDIDDPPPFSNTGGGGGGGGGASPMSISRGTPRRRINGTHHDHQSHAYHHQASTTTPRLKQLPVSTGLTVASKRRPVLGDEEIDRMLERAAAEVDGDSDSEGGIIEIPPGQRDRERERARREGAGVVGV